MIVRLVEQNEVHNFRILAETIADRIRKGEIKL
jgi:hypothetical protein